MGYCGDVRDGRRQSEAGRLMQLSLFIQLRPRVSRPSVIGIVERTTQRRVEI